MQWTSGKEAVLIGTVVLFAVFANGCSGHDDDGAPVTATPTVPAPTSTATLPPATPTGTALATSTPTRLPTASPTQPPPPTATPLDTRLRAAPYDVRDTSQPGQLTVYNSRRGGGSVGMPVVFGDVNGDGKGDFIACPMLTDSGPAGDRADAGEVHIYFGTGTISGVIVNTPEAANITTIMGARAGDLLGTKPEVVDVNADGFADVAIGAQNYDGLTGDRRNAGGVFTYFGRPDNPRTVDLAGPPANAAAVTTIVGAQPGDRLGIWVTAGDVDGDGNVDLILGADQADGPNDARPDSGAVYIVFGGQEIPAVLDLAAPGNLRIAVIHGIDPGDHLGSTVLATDVDGDGDGDLVVAGGLARGSSQIDGTFMAGGDGPNNDRPDAGEVYVLFSSVPFPLEQDLADLPAAERLTLYGANAADVTGEELAAGDLNGDGRVDVVVGSLQAPGPNGARSPRGQATGRTYVVFAAASRRGDAIDLADPGPGVTTIFGRRKAGISGDTLVVVDMDGDGIDDLWDASPSLGTRDVEGTFRPASGVLDILFGQPSWAPTIDLLVPPDNLRLVQIYGGDTNDMFAYGMAVGDANGDGWPDIITNAMAGDGFENMVPDAGEFYVLDNRALFDGATQPLPPLFLNIDIQPIFEATCMPCHAGDAPAADLALDIVQNSIEGLLGADGEGRQSTQVADLLVKAGDPDASYLIEKIAATVDDPPRFGTAMPPPPAEALPARVIADLRRWISAGAGVANEDLPPPPPPPPPPAHGFSTTFFARLRFVLADPALGEIESVLIDPPAPVPLRLIGPRLTVPAAEFETVTIPGGDFGDVDVAVRENGTGTIGRSDGNIELAITFIQIALDGAVEVQMPVTLTTGAASGGPFTTQGAPLDPIGGTLKLVGVATIPPDTAVIGGDPVLVELEGSVAPVIPAVPNLADEVQPIFTASCALVNCHVGDGSAGLNLEAGRAFAELVEVASTQVDELLVSPGQPEMSYLFEKVANETPRIGDRMPIGNALDALDIEAIRQWIAGGAPE